MRRFPFVFVILLVFVGWGVLQSLISLYPTFLWFDNLGFSSVFWINIKAKVLTGLVFGLLFLVIAAANIFVSRKLTKGLMVDRSERRPNDIAKMIRDMFGEGGAEGGEGKEGGGFINVTPKDLPEGRINLLWGIGILVFSIFMGLTAITQWQVFLKALNVSSFGILDPVFNQDVGFYIFTFPLHKFAQGFIFSAFVLSLIAAVWNYLINGAISFSGTKLSFTKGVKAHLAAVLAILSLLFAWGLWLGELEILYSARGVVFGAGYTDVNAQLFAYNLQIFVLCILAAIFLVNIFQKDYKLPIAGVGAYLVIALVVGGLYPAVVQNLQVKPNEISMEAPYIKNAIKYTRLAYGLDEVQVQDFVAEENLTLNDLRKNEQTVSNIRLWDNRPLIKTYRQLQGIRLYYDFNDVDVDRYNINGKYRQVMLSPREMRVDKLPEKAQTWVNQHLKFTHGYGLCMSPVNKQTQEGLPDLIVKDIPPITDTDLKIERPEIYYGEETVNYAVVNTKEKEFDYPKGDKNVYAAYQGKGGVRISSFLRRLAFAIKFSDTRILLTNYITPDSRVMFDRSISKRVKNIAPFLSYDRDPYLVVADSGRLFWIQDAYTVSDLYPYSDPSGSGFNKFNYIRNSVKVVMDAYNGQLTFYIVDEADPIARTYQKIYPKLFQSFADMPQDLKEHMRYPYDLFMIQAHKYSTYHMEDPEVYYNREDLWNIPKEIYASNEQAMDAYYTIMKLPQEKRGEFLLMLPFTPNDKDNMIAWLAGRSDMPNYGKLIVYKFPKDKLIYGPMQIEARIDQQTEISQQFTLWGQVGSRVIRGNLLAIPIEDSILYVEPVYLEAANGELPELKRVIVAYGKNVAMAETLNEAISAVFSGRSAAVKKTIEKIPLQMGTKELARKALTKLKDLERILKDLAK